MWPDFWLQPVRTETDAVRHALRLVAVELGLPWLHDTDAHGASARVAGRADGWFHVDVRLADREFRVRVAASGGLAEIG